MVSRVTVALQRLQADWGPRRYQGKICGKDKSHALTIAGRGEFPTKKQDVWGHVASHTGRGATVLDVNIGSDIQVRRAF